MPVQSGLEDINAKHYVSGLRLLDHNMDIIRWIAKSLDIKADIVYDQPTSLRGTERLIYNLKMQSATVYVTNPEAKDKYLHEDSIRDAGIAIEYCKTPKHLQICIWEAFERYGIEGTKKQLYREVEHAVA